ncbi:MAG: polyprenyl synthetase family protein [Burkholderiales bacterium]|jgi:farnesyl diphosphate synthase|nr:polyprenyl synthetase family protein [Polynucleobacter sp.]MCX7244646.1 polyprenyl synthetase family protein [Burkholderiales bacterium]
MSVFNFEVWMQANSARAEAALVQYLDVAQTVPQRLHQAMLYASLGGGKRIRPLLVYAAGELSEGRSLDNYAEASCTLDAAAAAIEMVHAYSLVHDDLPCMDDDDLRRGRPTVHKAFDEATALLVGDALQTRAFEVLALAPGNAEVRLTLIAALASAAGSRGMAGGQAIDLDSVGAKLDLLGLQNMHRLKTGALLSCAVQMGGLVAGLAPQEMRALAEYATALGLAFQVVDDVLDATADSQTLGKTAGKDAANDKPTYVTLMGLDYAQKQAKELQAQALASIDAFDLRADALRGLAALIVNRRK